MNKPQLFDNNKNVVLSLTPRQTDRLTFGRNITFDFERHSVSQSENCCGSVFVSYCCEKLVVEVGDSSGTQKKGNVRYQATASEDWTAWENLVICEVCRTVVTCSYELQEFSESDY
jgi:hypothetical protein